MYTAVEISTYFCRPFTHLNLRIANALYIGKADQVETVICQIKAWSKKQSSTGLISLADQSNTGVLLVNKT